ncbi:MAG TPA: hydantoinase [Rhodospirillaceae bacterium]|nr:hydantoinase [Rhodospirillaceae bacterium]
MPQKNTGKIVGVDVGGTFTDLILLDPGNSDVRLSKVPSTLDNQAFGALSALEEAAADLASIDLIVHGTTTTTNAVLERKLSRTGLITTEGFRDVLELGRRTRPDAYGMRGEFTPIIPRDLRLEVEERMDAEGRVVTPLREEDVVAAANRLLDQGCESVVIHFLHAYANPDHELRAGELVREIWPNDHVTMGHSLLSESREFERGVTAAVNASVQPLLEVYIRQLVKELASNGYGGEVLVMNGNGGMVSSRLVSREAAKTVMSGPASGVKAAAYTGSRAGFPNLLTYDMGGTSSDVALILDAEPAISNEIEIEYAMPIHVPMVDVRTVGAGGGSIARINTGGLLEVGPESAGAAPGPICYGRGGIQPTISDANLLLGRLNPGKFKSLETSVTIEQVSEIFERELGQTLGMDAVSAAEAVVRIANTKMAGAIRMVSLSLGADPRDFVLFAFGGAGPLHATALARELAVPRVLIPARPGITNALGCVVADLRHDFVNTINKPLDAVDIKEVHAVFARQIEEGERLINGEKIEISEVSRLFSVDMQFVGQTHVLRVDLDTAVPTVEDLLSAFEEAYFGRFRVELQEIRASLVNVNTSVIGKRSALDLSTLIDPEGRKSALKEAETERRDVYFDGKWKDTPIYWRDYLPADLHLEGPAIIEQMDCTTVLEPGDYADGDADGNIIITIGGLT